jgi:hypothetical protein
LGEPERNRQQHHHAEQEHHPRTILTLAESAEETQRVGGGSDGKNRRGRPAKQESDRVRQQGADPAEVASYVAVAVELGVALCGEGAGEKDSEEE